MPLFAAACWFSCGLVLARHHWTPTALLVIAVLVLFVATLLTLRSTVHMALLPLSALWIAAGMVSGQFHPVSFAPRELTQYADGLSRTVHGRVSRVRLLGHVAPSSDDDSDSTWWQERDPNTTRALSIDLTIDALEEVTPDITRMIPAKGGVRVTLLLEGMATPAVGCGDIVELPLRLRVPQRFNDPGAWQYADYLLQQGIALQSTAQATKLKHIGAAPSNLRCRLAAVQEWASNRMERFVRTPSNRKLPPRLQLTEDDAAMLNAMLFGDRTGLTEQLRSGFERTGSFHLFVVSGMHVSLLAAILLGILRRVGLSDGLATLVVLPAMTAYAFITGFGAPVQRALFMTTIFLIARLLFRDRSVLNAVGAAALAEMVLSPGSLFEASFQMTFLAVLAIAGIAIPLGEWTLLPWARATKRLDELWIDPVIGPKLAQFRVTIRLFSELLGNASHPWLRHIPTHIVRVGSWIAELALIGVITEMVMTLPMALYFHRATLFALPANMLTIPLLSLLVPLAIALFLVSLCTASGAVLFSVPVAAILHSIHHFIKIIGVLHSANIRLPDLAFPITLFALLVIAVCSWAAPRSRRWAFATISALSLATLAIWWPEPPILHSGQLEVTAIDVGQGDSIFLASPDGRTMLIDAGGPVGSSGETAAANGFDIGEEIVSPYLWSRRISQLDVLVLSHAHSDHMGGMAAVLRNLRPRELWVSIDANSQSYRALMVETSNLGIPVRHLRAGEHTVLGLCSIDVLAPEAGYRNLGDPTNDDSLVLRVSYGKASVLLEGDAEAKSEQTMAHKGLRAVTLLKVGHHGSRTSTTPQFFSALHPKAAIVSVGRGNSFGHPQGDIIARIANAGVQLYRTDEFGLTTLLLDQDGTIHQPFDHKD